MSGSENSENETDENEANGNGSDENETEGVDLTGARERLEAALTDSTAGSENDGEREPDDGTGNDGGADNDSDAENDGNDACETDTPADAGALLDRAETDVDSIRGVFRGEETFEEARDDIDDLLNVVDEAKELLDAIDLTAIPDAVALGELPSAIETSSLPEALAAAEPEAAVRLGELLDLVDLRTLLQDIDVRELHREKAEFDAAVDDATDDRDSVDDGTETTAETGTDRSGGGVGANGIENDESTGDEEISIPSEAIQMRIQSRLGDAIDEFRDSVLDARDRLVAMRERTASNTDDVGQPSSRNPTAYSTLPSTGRIDMGGVARFSTIPTSVRHTSAPGREHVYGSRFENTRNGSDNDE